SSKGAGTRPSPASPVMSKATVSGRQRLSESASVAGQGLRCSDPLVHLDEFASTHPRGQGLGNVIANRFGHFVRTGLDHVSPPVSVRSHRGMPGAGLHPQGQVPVGARSEEHTSELQSPYDLVCRLLLEKKKKKTTTRQTYN